MMGTSLLVKSDIEGLTLLRRGKVRDVYDLGEKLLIVSTDRLSAFDHVLATPIPDKGKILTQVSAFWFEKTRAIVPSHFLTADLAEVQSALPKGVRLDPEDYDGRVMLVWKAQRFDAECVVRGYLAGSGWKDYQKTGRVCGHALPAGLLDASKLPEPIFTPATKADEGHDENISREALARLIGEGHARELERLSHALYAFAAEHLKPRGIILADTKFEFGLREGKIIVIDEMLTPDSSRLWRGDTYKPGGSPESFDKQYVRDYLEKIRWDKQPPVPALPAEVVEGTARRYEEFLKVVRS